MPDLKDITDEFIDRAIRAYMRRARTVTPSPEQPSAAYCAVEGGIVTVENVNGVLARYRVGKTRLARIIDDANIDPQCNPLNPAAAYRGKRWNGGGDFLGVTDPADIAEAAEQDAADEARLAPDDTPTPTDSDFKVWAEAQRLLRAAGKLRPSRVRKLEASLGWTWDSDPTLAAAERTAARELAAKGDD